MRFIGEACFGDFIFDGVHGLEDNIREEPLAHVVPNVFEWRAVGWQGLDRHVFRDVESAETVAGSAIVDPADARAAGCLLSGIHS